MAGIGNKSEIKFSASKFKSDQKKSQVDGRRKELVSSTKYIYLDADDTTKTFEQIRHRRGSQCNQRRSMV